MTEWIQSSFQITFNIMQKKYFYISKIESTDGLTCQSVVRIIITFIGQPLLRPPVCCSAYFLNSVLTIKHGGCGAEKKLDARSRSDEMAVTLFYFIKQIYPLIADMLFARFRAGLKQ